ncbi:MAG: radical SAM protein, partial [Planctomycetes bacterium]|nr:radical SAM protein [Planctomycetota bacterium]
MAAVAASVGIAMADAGFAKTRIVLQQWNKNFRPSQMRLDGRIPDVFMLSSMQIHTAALKGMIRDACRIDESQRPLIIAGGAKTVYEPWDVFSADPQDPWGADVAVTGEEFVFLSLLEVLLSLKSEGGTLRDAFRLARETAAFFSDQIP